MLTKVRYELLHELLLHPSVLGHFSISFLLNWVLGPALMTGLAWACLPDLPGFRAGVIMVGLARCIGARPRAHAARCISRWSLRRASGLRPPCRQKQPALLHLRTPPLLIPRSHGADLESARGRQRGDVRGERSTGAHSQGRGA